MIASLAKSISVWYFVDKIDTNTINASEVFFRIDTLTFLEKNEEGSSCVGESCDMYLTKSTL